MFSKRLAALVLCSAVFLLPALAEARPSGSIGSRGSRTFTAPPPTSTAPSVKPIQQSVTPAAPAQQLPGGAASPGALPQSQPSFAQRNPFLTGLAGGLFGAGIGSMLFGNGFGMSGLGFAGGLGLLLQLALIAGAAWLAYSFFRGRRSASGPIPYYGANVSNAGFGGGTPLSYQPVPVAALPRPNGRANDELEITAADQDEFERLLTATQHAWSNSDVAGLRRLVTPEMLSYFAEQLAAHASKGVVNTVADVKLEQGELAEAWNEGPVDYATVSLAYSALDYTLAADDGRLIDGSKTQRERIAETWTFMRQAAGGRWLLSAVQQ